MPKVSVIILSHRPDLLPEAFASALQQTYRDREIVVKFCEAYWDDKLNEAVRATSSPYFVVLCDDDKLAPTYLARTVEEIERTGADIAYTDNQVFGIMPMKQGLPDFSLATLNTDCVPHFTALCRRDMFDAVGGYDGAVTYMDWDFWYRCAQHGADAVHLKGEYLFHYRVWGTNGSRELSHATCLAQLQEKHPNIIACNDRVKVA
jgi:glycosyltransferase involved in cell wall biosynthesis